MKIQKLTEEILTTVKNAVHKHKGADKWSPKKSGEFVVTTCETFEDERGKPVRLTEEEREIIKGVCNATVASRHATIRYVLAQREVKLDAEVEALIAKFFNAAAVQKQVEASAKPEKKTLRELIG